MITDIEQVQLAAVRSWLDTTESLLGDDHRAEASRQIRHLMRDLLTLADAIDTQERHDASRVVAQETKMKARPSMLGTQLVPGDGFRAPGDNPGARVVRTGE